MISIVVSCYNSSKTIGNLLDSFVRQTNKDFEIILVNDGSTDSSLSIVKKYMNKLNLTVLNKENGGPCSAVSLGIDYAKGDYILTVDSDDTVNDDLIEKISIEKKDYDILCFGYNIVNIKEKIGEWSHAETIYRKDEIKNLLNNLYFENHSFTTFKILPIYRWTKLIKTSIVKKINYEYRKLNFGMYEDLVYTFLTVAESSTIKIIPFKGINYFQRKNTHSRSAFNGYKYLLELREKLRIFLNDFAEKNDLNPDIFATMEFDVSKFYLSRLIKKSNYKQSKDFFKQLKNDKLYKEEKKLVNASNESFARKIYFFFLKYNMFLLIYLSFKWIQREEI